MFEDLRLALRRLLRSTGFTIASVVTLAVGIGATTAIFTLANAALLRPLPYANTDRLVHLWDLRADNDFSRSEASYPDYQDWQAQSRTVERFAGYSWPRVTLRGLSGAEQLQAVRVTDGFFDVLGVKAAIGRTFAPGEDVEGGPRLAVLSNGLWKRHFGSDRSIVGKPINIDGETFEVIGVLPEAFHFAPSRGGEVWLPLQPPERMRTARGMHWLNTIALLRPGVSAETAERELNTIAARLEKLYPDTNEGVSVEAVGLRQELVGPVRPIVSILGMAGSLVLLIACVNVASLMIGRVASKQRDVSIRLALGADRGRIVRHLLSEALLLSVAGALLGAFVGVWSLRALVDTVPENMLAMLPYLRTLTLDGRVLALVSVVIVGCALAIGLWPALRATAVNVDVTTSLNSRGASGSVQRRLLRSGLVVAEVALALVLLTGAGLTLRSLSALFGVEAGYEPEGVLTMRVALPMDRYATDEALGRANQRILDAVSTIPGVDGVAAIDKLPSIGGTTMGFRSAGMDEAKEANIRVASPGYFRVMGVRVLRGREFDGTDRPGSAPVIVVNRLLARRHLGDLDAVGRTVRIADRDFTVAGVVADERVGPLDEPVTPVLYAPLAHLPNDSMALVIRTAGDPAALAQPVAGAVRNIDRDIAVAGVATMTSVVASAPMTFLRRVSTIVIGAFALVALFLALVGIYAVIAESVGTRTKEIGVRMSFGAGRGRIVSLILREGMSLVAIGLGAGLAAAIVLVRFMKSILFGISAYDPLTFAGVAAALAGTALVAALVPAWRASRVDPMTALRQE